jgi:hypothetical protein
LTNQHATTDCMDCEYVKPGTARRLRALRCDPSSDFDTKHATFRPSDLLCALCDLRRAQGVFRPPLVVCRSHKSSDSPAQLSKRVPVARMSAQVVCRAHGSLGRNAAVHFRLAAVLCRTQRWTGNAREVSAAPTSSVIKLVRNLAARGRNLASLREEGD